uniref:iron chaperone n=2 Tax=Loigolactobacillus backii TaxID=375175 RepID=UPI001CDD6645
EQLENITQHPNSEAGQYLNTFLIIRGDDNVPKKPEVADVADYINKAVPQAQPLLNQLRTIVKTGLPAAEEKISWGQPFYLLGKKRVSFAAYKAHVSFTSSDDLPETIRQKVEQAGYTTGQKRINITFSQPVPTDLIHALLESILKDS